MSHERYQPAVQRAGGTPREARILACSGARLLVARGPDIMLPRWEDLLWHADPAASLHYMGIWDDQPLYTLAFDDTVEPGDPWFWTDLRGLLGQVDDQFFQVAGRALQLLQWAADHRHCGRCGTLMVPDARGERALVCPSCGHTAYPRINPCVIGVVTRGDELLLARAHRFKNGMFSALAGFMEVGESAEQTLMREVREEVGVEIRDIRYFGSQSWPFPSNLMLGFTADYAGGKLCLQDDEIAEAGFFRYDNLPLVPPHGSIARALIDHLVSERMQRNA